MADPPSKPPPPGETPPGETRLDLTKPAPGEVPSLSEVPPHSEAWAKIIWPITRSILALIAAVMIIPFIVITLDNGTRTDKVLDWAKTILPPVVGFGGAIMGYYFGTRSGQSGGEGQEADEE